MQTIRFRIAWMVALVLVLAMAGAAALWGAASVRAQETLRYEQYDVDIDVAVDGSFTVTATQTVRFDDAYSTAFAEIPTDRAQAIRDVAVYQRDPESGALTPLAFSVSEGAGAQSVDWEYDEVQAGDARTFVLRYTVEGGLWIYSDRDILRWFAVNADRSGLPVENASVTVTLPDAAAGSLSAEVISGNGAAVVEGTRAVITASGPLADGEPLEIEVGFAHGVVAAQPPAWQRAEDAANVRVEITQVGVGVVVQADGRLDVNEESSVAVDQGVLQQGSRTIRLVYMDALRDIRVLQDGEALAQGQEGCTNCYVVHEQPAAGEWAQFDRSSGQVVVDEARAGEVTIDWYGAPVVAGEATVITLQYSIVGGVRVGDDNQAIHLEVLPDYDALTARAWLQLTPPPRTNADAISVESGAAIGPAEAQADGSLLFSNWDLPADRARWEVVVIMPAGATTAATPQWQAQFERALAAQTAVAAAAARRTLATRTGALVVGAAGIATGLWIWVRYGRKRTRALLNGYVAEPPSKLAPGIVAYLMDRNSSERGVLASLLELATAGLIQVDLSSGVQLRRTHANAVTPGQRLAAGDGAPVVLAPHQVMLFNDVVLPNVPSEQFVALDTLAAPLRARLPYVYAQMGEDAQSYFLADQGGAGCLAGCLSPTWLIVMATLALGVVLLLGGNSTWVLLFALGGFAFAALMLVLALGQPFGRRRSATGEAEAEKWSRFRNYLQNLKEYGDLGAAQEILDRYFAYALALGVESVVLAQAEALGASMPPWMAVPVHLPGMPSSSSATGEGRPYSDAGPRPAVAAAAPPATAPLAASGPQPGAARPAARPSLSGLSRGMGEALTGASRSMGTTLSAAAGATAATVVIKSQLRDRTLEWGAQSDPTRMLDEVMRVSLRDAENLRNRPAQSGPQSPGWGGRGLGGGGSRSTWGGGSSGGGSSSRSSGSFGRSSSSSSSASRSSSSSSSRSSSSSSSSRSSSSSGGGRSGFGKK